eukprot:Skav214219  [mRNA]  locus=scaffold489:555068:560453:+ [translate_table: standard]
MSGPHQLPSKQWSCGSLATGNEKLLASKMEPRDRKEELEKQKKALEDQIAALDATDAEMAGAATEEELNQAKRPPPGSTKTTPVKGQAADPAVLSLQAKLDQAMAMINQADASSGTRTPSSDLRSPSVLPPSSTTPSSAAKLSPPSVEKDSTTPAAENDDEDEHRSALKRYRMVDARLRRLCEQKGSGKCNVPQVIHDAWKRGGQSRDELRVNDKYSSKVYKYYVEYADKTSHAKIHTESETHTTAEEALQIVDDAWDGSLRRVTLEQLFALLGSIWGEMEMEQKFEDGMLSKLSKMTDLITRLEGWGAKDELGAEEKSRANKLITTLETKISAAQDAYDTFVEARSNANVAKVKQHMKNAMAKNLECTYLLSMRHPVTDE